MLALEVLAFKSKLRWQAFEEFNREYFALRMALARHYGYKSMSVQELHEGAWVEKSVGTMRVVFDMKHIGAVDTLSSRYPQSAEELETGIVYRNANGAACDLVTVLTLEGSGSRRLLMLHECKHTRKPVGDTDTTVNAQDVQVALNKIRSALPEVGENIPVNVVVFISNRAFKGGETTSSLAKELDNANLKKTVVIVRDNCLEYFGPSLARRFMGYFELPM